MNLDPTNNTYSCRVIANEVIAPGVHYLRFERPFDFVAGQVVAVSLAGISPRLYSIASGVGESNLAILFDVVTSGLLTPLLAKLQPRELIGVSAPTGSFSAMRQPAMWIATGTGIAPFVAMVKSGAGDKTVLIHGASTVEKFYFSELFQSIKGLSYVRCASKEQGMGIYAGRLTHYIMLATDLPVDIPYYICGSPLMVNQVRDLLISKGIAFNRIFSEIYF